jgi:hypothetical protein
MSNGHLHQEEWRHWLLVSALSGQLWVIYLTASFLAFLLPVRHPGMGINANDNA